MKRTSIFSLLLGAMMMRLSVDEPTPGAEPVDQKADTVETVPQGESAAGDTSAAANSAASPLTPPAPPDGTSNSAPEATGNSQTGAASTTTEAATQTEGAAGESTSGTQATPGLSGRSALDVDASTTSTTPQTDSASSAQTIASTEAEPASTPQSAYAFAQSMDAKQWAEAFMRIVVGAGREIDEGLMVTWFANSIMRGWDGHAQRGDLPADTVASLILVDPESGYSRSQSTVSPAPDSTLVPVDPNRVMAAIATARNHLGVIEEGISRQVHAALDSIAQLLSIKKD